MRRGVITATIIIGRIISAGLRGVSVVSARSINARTSDVCAAEWTVFPTQSTAQFELEMTREC